MGTQGYRANYREAFECANHQLEGIYTIYRELQLRKGQLESALAALDPFLNPARNASEEVFAPEPMHKEKSRELDYVPEPALRAIPTQSPISPVATAEPVVAPSYAPVSEANVDPIQARINRALGLAVA